MPEPTYRKATPDDAQAIAAVAAAVAEELGDLSGLPGEMTPGALSMRIGGYGKNAAIFLCESEEEICGFTIVEPDQRDDTCAETGVWLLASARRQGIGRWLALMALDFARAAGYSKVRGTIPKGNEAALSFFSEIGALAQVVGGGMQYELPL
jgi:ribosomal protein S18 acetylase RimI-like enzyme